MFSKYNEEQFMTEGLCSGDVYVQVESIFGFIAFAVSRR
jgi:hypothetical protein